MTLNVLRFSDAANDPLELRTQWNSINLRYCVAHELRKRILLEGCSVADLEAPIFEFEQLVARIDEQHVVTLTAAYHNAEHARSVATRYQQLLAAAGASEVIQQLGKLVGLLHDAGHPGQRYREDSPGVACPELSNEEYAGALAVEVLGDCLNTSQLAWVYSAILASSFGQRQGADPSVNAILQKRPHLIRPYAPEQPHERLFHLADINPTMERDGINAFVYGGFRLAMEVHQSMTLRWSIEDFGRFFARQSSFLEYISGEVMRVKELFVVDGFSEMLQAKVAETRAFLSLLKGSVKTAVS